MKRWLSTSIVALVFAGCSDAAKTIPGAPTGETEQSRTNSDVQAVNKNEHYKNPVDKKTYVAEENWKTYKPQPPSSEPEKARIHNGGVRLLTSQDEIARRTTVESLAAFINRAESSAQSTLKEATTNAQVLVQFSCSPGKHAVQLAHHGNVTQDQLQTLYDGLLALEAMPVSSGEVSFQVTIQIDPVDQR